jgi:iron transport multicopper oxidase
MKLFGLIFILCVLNLTNAEIHTWYFKTGWVKANPDGVYERNVIGFNDTWLLPTLRVRKGDMVNLYLTNGFDDRNTSIHFHGLFQNGSSQMDGVEMVTQCPIPPGETMLYNFTVSDQTGTYWYHSHTSGQRIDGMRGAFIIEDHDCRYEYDEEVVLTLSDWYHKNTTELLSSYLNPSNSMGAEPIPQNLLFNDTRNNTWHVEPNKTYLVRIINLGGFVSQYLYMEDHEFDVVEIDGVGVEKNTTDMLYITVGQRYGVLIKTKDNADKNFAFMSKLDDSMLMGTIPKDLELNSTNYIIYDDDKMKPEQYIVNELNFLNDFYLKPLSKTKLFDCVDQTITLDVTMGLLSNGINYAFFNNITYIQPKVPTLVTALSAGELASNSLVYGTNTNTFVLRKNDVIDIVVNNYDEMSHPFHLHGHNFQLVARDKIPADESTVPNDHPGFPEYPMMRDTVNVEPSSYIVIRFIADNPGVWFFHCHVDWHLEQGLAMTFVEAPEELQKNPSQALTENNKDICEKSNVPTKGNAAANFNNYLDLKGQNIQLAKKAPEM